MFAKTVHSTVCNSCVQFSRMKRVFKTNTFDRWARKVVSDSLLCQAAREIEQGVLEADWVAACAKSECRYADRVRAALHASWWPKSIWMRSSFWQAAKIIAQALERAGQDKLDGLVADDILKEICHGK